MGARAANAYSALTYHREGPTVAGGTGGGSERDSITRERANERTNRAPSYGCRYVDGGIVKRIKHG